GLPGVFRVLGSHDYAEAGTYLVTTTVSACGETLGTGYSSGLVDEAEVDGVAAEVPATSAVDGQQMGLSDVGLSRVVLATFTDANPLSTAWDFAATIDWGDADAAEAVGIAEPNGSSPPEMKDVTAGQVVRHSDGTFWVLGSHAY